MTLAKPALFCLSLVLLSGCVLEDRPYDRGGRGAYGGGYGSEREQHRDYDRDRDHRDRDDDRR
jgi:hypothetical protein